MPDVETDGEPDKIADGDGSRPSTTQPPPAPSAPATCASAAHAPSALPDRARRVERLGAIVVPGLVRRRNPIPFVLEPGAELRRQRVWDRDVAGVQYRTVPDGAPFAGADVRAELCAFVRAFLRAEPCAHGRPDPGAVLCAVVCAHGRPDPGADVRADAISDKAS